MAEVSNISEADTETFVSWREFLTSKFKSSLALVCLAVWLHAAESLIVATMLPSIVADVGGAGLVGWSVSLYEIASVVAGAASALLAIRYGLRTPMSLAAAVFGIGCLLSALSPNMPLVLAGRVLQGLGGGGLVSLSFVAVGVIFPRRYMARALASVSTFWGVSAFLGPLIGGFFVEYASWRWGFGFFAMQAFGLAIWIALRPDHAAAQSTTSGSFPIKRLALLCLAILLVSAGGVEVEPLQTSLFVAAGILCLLAFLHLDGRAGSNRLLPLRPLSINQTTGSALLMILSLSIATIALTAFSPLLMTLIHGTSAITTGYIVACSSIGWTLAAVFASGSPERMDRLMIAIGIILVVTSVVGFVYAIPNGPVWLVAVFAAMDGAGFGLAWTFILRRTTSLADKEEVKRISGAMPTIQRLGYALGAAYVGIVANAIGFANMTDPDQAANIAKWVYIACIPFGLLALVAMLTLVKKQPDFTAK